MTVRLKDEAALKAASATKLATARTINGTSFDGSANITTSNWGTARTITIGNSGKSVNGSGNVSWSLSEIGAAAASHTHNYAGSSSAGGAANSANKVEIPDTRSVNDTPAQLGASRGISANFKQSATVGLSDGTYSAVMNIVPWSDVSSWSGGKITQMAFSDSGSIYVRKGNGSGWDSWRTIAYTNSSITGNAATATKLQTARTISLTGQVTGSASFDGSANASISAAIVGKTITNTYTTAFRTQVKGNSSSGDFIAPIRQDTASVANTPQYGSGVAFGRGDTHGYLYLNYSSAQAFLGGGNADKINWTKEIAFKDSSITGNAATATTLQTARTINGTSFNGSANITTANWGTARTITIGNTAKSVNGSGNVSWTLAEIGAAAASHTHSYLPLSGGTLTGTLTTGAVQRDSRITTGNTQIYNVNTAGTQIYVGNPSTNLSLEGKALMYNVGGQSGQVMLDRGGIFEGDVDMFAGTRLSFSGGKSYVTANVFSLNKDYTGDSAYLNIYLGPAESGEARVCAWGSTDGGYRPIRASRFNTSSGSYLETNLSLSGNTVLFNGTNSVVQANAGYLVLRANASQPIYIQGSETRVVAVNQTSTYVPFRAGATYVNGALSVTGATTAKAITATSLTASGNVKSGNVYMNGANSIRNDTRELYLAGTHADYPSYLGSLSLTADSGGGRFYSMSIYNRKYTASANMHVTSAGTVGYTSSARRYKLDIKDVEADKPELILDLEPKTWFDKTATEQYANYLTRVASGDDVSIDDEDIPFLDRQNGLIAEDVEEAGLGQFVNYGDPDEDGNREVMGIQYDRLWTLLIPVVRDLKKTVEAQQTEINELKALLKEQAA